MNNNNVNDRFRTHSAIVLTAQISTDVTDALLQQNTPDCKPDYPSNRIQTLTRKQDLNHAVIIDFVQAMLRREDCVIRLLVIVRFLK